MLAWCSLGYNDPAAALIITDLLDRNRRTYPRIDDALWFVRRLMLAGSQYYQVIELAVARKNNPGHH